MIRVIKDTLEEEIVFTISAVLAVGTSFLVPPSFSSIDLKVIFSLFNLMLMSLAFEKYRLLDGIAVFILSKSGSQRGIGFTMILTTAALGMLMTNDVALLTVVPITLAMARKAGFDPFRIVVLETAAANIGSSLTPFGNPQNLFLYSFYKMDTFEFFSVIAPFVVSGLAILLLLNSRNPKAAMESTLHEVTLKHPKRLAMYGVLFILVLLSVLRLFDHRIITVIVTVVVILFDHSLFKRLDWFLLGTFVAFFIFIDNVTRLDFVQRMASGFLDSPVKVFGASAILSQAISNVPTSILLSGFTQSYRELFLGVSVGGLGTLVASLANLISYKIHVKSYDKKTYLAYFHKVNAGLFLGFFAAFALIALVR